MEVIVKNSGLKLIKKYEKYYIRFIGGQYAEYPCDLLITDGEAREILSDNSKIKEIMVRYEGKIPWILSTFVDSAIRDYMFYECKLSEKRIKKNMEKLNRHTDIKMEFYETIMYEQFPVNSPITVKGYIAEQLYQNTYLSVLGAYNYLIYLREAPINAIEDLKQGLPIK